MNAFKQLKTIAENQKTVKTSRLQPIIKQALKKQAEQGKVIKAQKEENAELREKIGRQKREIRRLLEK